MLVLFPLLLLLTVYCKESIYDCNQISETSIFGEELESQLYFASNDTNYLNLSQQFASNCNESIVTHPSIIAVIKLQDDISSLLLFAAICEYKVVVRSGGHQYSGLSSCNSYDNNCIQIDVSLLNEIEISVEMEVAIDNDNNNDNVNHIISCGPGVTLLKLYTELSKFNLFLPGGVGQTVNLGGHVQTNGFGLLTRSIGLLSDFIISFDIYIHNGTLLHVSKYDTNHDNMDLFFAVLGGNPGNFGVIVNYTFVALKDSDYVNSTSIKCEWIYNKITYKQLMNGYIDTHNDSLYIDNNDVMLYVFILPNFDNHQHVLMLFGIWTQNISMNIVDKIISQVSAEPILYEIDKDFMSNLLIKNTFPTLHNIQYPPMYLRAGYTKTNWNKSFTDVYVDDIEFGLANNLYFQILFQSYGGKSSSLLNSNIGSFAHRDIFLALEMFMYYYDDEKDIAHQWINATWTKWEEILFKEKIKIFFGTFGTYYYHNINMNQQYPYFYKTQSMYNRLREIKTKFDPNDLFHHPLGLPLL